MFFVDSFFFVGRFGGGLGWFVCVVGLVIGWLAGLVGLIGSLVCCRWRCCYCCFLLSLLHVVAVAAAAVDVDGTGVAVVAVLVIVAAVVIVLATVTVSKNAHQSHDDLRYR